MVKIQQRTVDQKWLRYANLMSNFVLMTTQPVITCSKLPTDTLQHGVKYVQS